MEDLEALLPPLPSASSSSLPTPASSSSSTLSSLPRPSSSSSSVSASPPPRRHQHHRQSPPPPPFRLEEGMLRRLNAPPPPHSLSLLLTRAFAWSKEGVTSARKVWMPLVLFAVVGICHLLGWAMLVYSALAIWGPTTPAAAAVPAAAPAPAAPPSSPSVLAAASSEEDAMLQMKPPQFISGPVSLTDFQSVGFVIYMTSVFASFLWLQHFVRTQREELAAREEQRWRGVSSMSVSLVV